MPKTIVNIITEDNPIPAYLFIKEMYKEGDKLMYISAKDTEDDLDALSDLFSVPAGDIKEIVLKNDIDELKYENICRAVLGYLNHDVSYCVNLAGGTRYMALAVQQVFERFDSEFFYVQVEENMIVKSKFDDSIFNNDDIIYPVRHRMTIVEYLKAHEIQNDLDVGYLHLPIREKEDAKLFFEKFTQRGFTGQDYKTMETLREYRNMRSIQIITAETVGYYQYPPVQGLSGFLVRSGFVPERMGTLNKREIEYLTGGWFEEYVYFLIRKNIKPQDMALGVRISRSGVRHDNELDVVFTKGNKLFVIECKTGVQTDRLFNDIVYKACAIKEALLGVSCFSYIFSLRKDDTNNLKRIADNMELTFVDHDILMTPRKLRLAMARMDIQSKDKL